MLDIAKINGIIRTAIAIVSGALVGAGFDVGQDFTQIAENAATILGLVGGVIATGWSIYNKVTHKEEVVKAASTGIAEAKS